MGRFEPMILNGPIRKRARQQGERELCDRSRIIPIQILLPSLFSATVYVYIYPPLSLCLSRVQLIESVLWSGISLPEMVTGERRRESLLELRAIDNPPTGRTALEDILRLNCVCGVNGNPIPSRFAIYRRKFAVRTLESARDQIWMRGKTRPI